jgi:hypothetical protein
MKPLKKVDKLKHKNLKKAYPQPHKKTNNQFPPELPTFATWINCLAYALFYC